MCCFIGYNQRKKAYKLYDLEEKKVIMSRDVVFYEDIFHSRKMIYLKTDLPIPNVLNEDFDEFIFKLS